MLFKKKKLINTLLVLLLLITPVVLINASIIKFDHRIYILLAVFLIFLISLIFSNMGAERTGWRIDNLKKSGTYYAIATVVIILAIEVYILVADPSHKVILSKDYGPHFSLTNILILSFSQELVFRSYLVPFFKSNLNGKYLGIIVGALLFGVMHTIFSPPIILFLLTMFMGLVWNAIYLKYPNILAATISHAAVNFVFVSHCMISSFPQCVS